MKYEESKAIDVLEKYVVSETISPIADYKNAIEIIRANYCCQVNSTLLIIGAYLASEWSEGHNELLEILNKMYGYLPQKEKMIVHFLNAHHLRFRDPMYKCNPNYKMHLLKSLNGDTPFATNRRYLAELYAGDKAKEMYTEAMSNVVKVHSKSELEQMTIVQLVEPEAFINEHILGTHISYINYEILCDEAKNLGED